MSEWRCQRGEINIGCIIGIIFLIVAVLVAIKTAPVFTNNGDFLSTVEAQADRANIPGNTDAKIRAKILDKAASLGLPIEDSQLKIKRTKNAISIKVEYDTVIDYGFYTWHRHEVVDVERPLF